MLVRLRGFILVGLVALFGITARAATPEEVKAAITKAKNYLHAHQNKDGNWEEVEKPDPQGTQADVKGKQWGGLTSIATYALLAAGENPLAELAKPIKFLKEAKIEGIYATGLRCQVWLLDDDERAKLRPNMEGDLKTLEAGIHRQGGASAADQLGFYGYWFDKGPQPGGWYDRSVSQYGVLGMWALEQAGMEVPSAYWQLVDAAWKRGQNPNGSWSYQKGKDESPAMTAAGIATLFITQDYTSGAMAECHGNIVNVNIDRGLTWMDHNIHQALGGNYYAMYGIERIGVASGRKYFETVDWYQTGADFLVKHQGPDGQWDGGIGGPVASTCFGLLFLVRGQAPVVMNKLEYQINERSGKTVDGPWNERRAMSPTSPIGWARTSNIISTGRLLI